MDYFSWAHRRNKVREAVEDQMRDVIEPPPELTEPPPQESSVEVKEEQASTTIIEKIRAYWRTP